MKISDIIFEDEAFAAAVAATGCENAEDVIEIRARKSAIKSANEIKYFKNLKLLDLTRNRLTEIDVSNNTALEELYLGSNEIEELDLSNNHQLKHLEVFINDLSELDISQSQLLENLYANKNDLTQIDLSRNPHIEELQLSDNELEKVVFPETFRPYIVKLENTKIDDSTKSYLKQLVGEHNLKL